MQDASVLLNSCIGRAIDTVKCNKNNTLLMKINENLIGMGFLEENDYAAASSKLSSVSQVMAIYGIEIVWWCKG